MALETEFGNTKFSNDTVEETKFRVIWFAHVWSISEPLNKASIDPCTNMADCIGTCLIFPPCLI